MKVILTGSLGHIGKPLTQTLVSKGHTVTVVSSNPAKQPDIEALGATAAIGNMEDVDFLTRTFKGADVVYSMIPPAHVPDLDQYIIKLGDNYAIAIRQSGVKRLIHLSSIGAHLSENSGLIRFYHEVEILLQRLSDVDITFIRPTAFYYNLYAFIPVIKQAGAILANYGGKDVISWVSPIDIAAAIAEEIETTGEHRKIRYVASEDLSCNEVARILGNAIGQPDLQWHIISNEKMLEALQSRGLNPAMAAGLVEMNASMHTGLLFEDYHLHKPTVMGTIKLSTFAKEFAAAFK